ncbi:methylated-DNA--protein-cysteine methyltransferase, constitutive [Oxobacter pfennigii]|uniref:Methylated-DNA--protein-cysteine methyltransferase n=1 Tax=Oxobacter pfennigii TaxID=36849 RepID=A0A0P9ABB9_9CLOT|nr:methylated-DNA--[protein]-cysteine S-methyltransferase [Oxobacter pfennigii]KPU42355.1 methylated-DNA--protein-cysteine methyltransferase, constitutive [Oxobacter pfennigii]
MPAYFYESILGEICIAENNGEITNVYFPNEKLSLDMEIAEAPILKEANNQLQSYLKGQLKEFSLPLNPKGTEFMKKVWIALCEIPYGETASYKDIAEKIGSPKAARAVGLANNRNPIPIIIPCHRVIGKNGSLIGYGGGLELKKTLLSIEER